MGLSKTSPPVLGGTSDAEIRAEVERVQAAGLPPQVGRAFNHFTDAVGTRLPNRVTSAKAALRRINRLR